MEKLDLKLLFIEDDLLIRESSVKLLQKIATVLHIAEDGQKGLDMFYKYQPDVILTDINIPKIDGLTLTKKISSINKDIPIILITSHTETQYLLEAIKNRVYGFILKPLEIESIYSILEKLSREILLKKEIKRSLNRMQTLLDLQANMVMMADRHRVYEANKSLLNFLGCSTIGELNERYTDIGELFEKDDGYLFSDEEASWFDKLLNHSHVMPKIKIKNLFFQSEHIFLIKHNRIPFEETIILSLTDITDLHKQTIDLKKEAITDQLTGLYNRRKFNEVLKNHLLVADTRRIPISIIMLDIDHFKSVNDTYGHQIGDRVIIELTRIVSNGIRKTDFFARWGGEEFIILLPHTNLQGGKILCNKLLEIVYSCDFNLKEKVTISIGLTTNREQDTKESIIARADNALYRAKNDGRNCYKVSL